MDPTNEVTVSLVQATPTLGDIPANLSRIEEIAGSESSDLIVFPELFLTGYQLKDELPRLAVQEDGPELAKLQHIAAEHEKHIIVGAPFFDERDFLHNASLFVGPAGLIGNYFKWFFPNFLPFDEKRYFKAGTELPVFDTPLGRIGLQICYDVFFPELTTILALKGADIIVNISAAPTMSRYFFETVIPARATENTVFFLYDNLTGTDERLTFWGGASVHSPKGFQVAKGEYFKEQVVRSTLDFREIAIARSGRTVLRDKRADAFSMLDGLI